MLGISIAILSSFIGASEAVNTPWPLAPALKPRYWDSYPPEFSPTLLHECRAPTSLGPLPRLNACLCVPASIMSTYTHEEYLAKSRADRDAIRLAVEKDCFAADRK